jgi:uncharacterized membrane-anchored protein YitT (DUF2179 family)
MQEVAMPGKSLLKTMRDLGLMIVGALLFGVGFDMFLQPNQINVGGVSGIGQILGHVLGFGSVAFWSLMINVPLFLISIRGVGREFFVGSLIGMLLSVCSFFFGVRSFKEKDTAPGFSIAGTIIGGIVMLGWLMVFLMGVR